jgi:hypothetical protein
MRKFIHNKANDSVFYLQLPVLVVVLVVSTIVFPADIKFNNFPLTQRIVRGLLCASIHALHSLNLISREK